MFEINDFKYGWDIEINDLHSIIKAVGDLIDG